MSRSGRPFLVLLFLAACAAGAWWSRGHRSETPAFPRAARPPAPAESSAARPAPAPEAQSPPAATAQAPPRAAPPPDPARAAQLQADAEALLRDAKIKEAVGTFEEALRADPDSAEIHGEYGRLLRDLTAIDRALYHLRRAAELDPNNADRWIDLANAYYAKADPGDAWQAEERAREAEPGLKLRRDRRGFLQRGEGQVPDRK